MKSRVADETQAYMLDQHAVPVTALARSEGDAIRCVACGHRCLIREGLRGVCKVRFVRDGQLHAPWGYVASVQCDPVEKKPFFHVWPGSDALTFGMLGCDYHCAYCQNWFTSQTLRDVDSRAGPRPVSADQIVALAQREGARLVVSSYNEPLITAEWAVEVFSRARAVGLGCAFVSNGNATPEALDHLAPFVDAYKVDLKGFDDRRYRTLGGTLQSVLDTIVGLRERGVFVEIVTLLVPGFNDSEAEIRELTRFVASVDRDMPWHVTAFHADYRMQETAATADDALVRAATLGVESGLRYVYAGNRPGRTGTWEDTRCPGCGDALIERTGFLVRAYRLTGDGSCPRCACKIPGRWPSDPARVRVGGISEYSLRMPRPV